MHETVLSESRTLPWFGWSRPGRAFVVYRNCKEIFLQIRKEGMMGIWIVDFFNAMSSTLPILKMAWLDSLLKPIFSFARSSRKQVLLEPIWILSISYVFVSVSSFSVRWVSAFASEVVAPVDWFALPTSVACFVSSCIPARLSQVARCFQMLRKSSSRLGCWGWSCCCVCQ